MYVFASWLPSNAIEGVALSLGIIMGFVFSFSSWRGSTKDVQLKDDPRVKSLAYGLGGFLIGLIGDWKNLVGDQTIDKTHMLGFYIIPFVSVSLLSVGATALFILLRFKWIKRQRPEEFPGEPFSPTMDYLHYGYQYLKQEYDRLMEDKRRDELSIFRQESAAAANSLAAMILAVQKYHKNPTAELLSSLASQLLQQMCLIVRSHMRTSQQPEINANYMLAVPFDKATDEEKRTIKFFWGDRARYAHLLVIKEYAYPSGQESFSLPVEDVKSDWPVCTLPGGPEAFLRKKEIVVETEKLDFARKVPKNVRDEISEYFKGKDFKSFACLIIPGASGLVVGIVNIESKHEHIFQRSSQIQNEIAKLLQPFCCLLGILIEEPKKP